MAEIKINKTAAAGVETPLADKVSIFVDSADGKLKHKDENGDVEILSTKDYVDNSFKELIEGGYFGNGQDGDVTISGTVTLTRDMYYNNLTIPSGQILNPNGYRIYVKGSLTGAGKIQRNGTAGNTGATGSHNSNTAGAGVAAPAVLNQGSLNAEVQSSTGGSKVYQGNGGDGVQGTAANPSYTNIAGTAGGAGGSDNGGATGSRSGGVGGAAGVSTRGPQYNTVSFGLTELLSYLFFPAAVKKTTTVYGADYFNTTQYLSICGAAGGGGGGGHVTGDGLVNGTGSGGGSGGGNGGFMRAAINTVNRTGTREAIGGVGGAGGPGTTQPTQGPSFGPGGGGAGGNGGIVILIYKTLTSLGTPALTGGAGGAAGATNLAAPASAGSNGSDGEIISIQIV